MTAVDNGVAGEGREELRTWSCLEKRLARHVEYSIGAYNERLCEIRAHDSW